MSTLETTELKNTLSSKWLFLLGVIVGYLPLVSIHFHALWTREQYQYFPFVLAAIIYLFWTRWKICADAKNPPSKFDTALLVLSWIILLVATLFRSFWLAAVSMIFVFGWFVMQIRNQRRVTNAFGIWCLGWLVIPPPLGLDARLVQWLQVKSSQISSAILDLIQVNHLMEGNVLRLPGRDLFVDEACSGIVSVMSVIAAGAVLVVYMNRSLLHSICVIFGGVVWAVVMNVARICIIAYVGYHWDIDWASGTPHTILGLVLFTLTFVALISTDRLAYFALAPINVAGQELGQNALIRQWNRMVTALTPQPQWTDDEISPNKSRINLSLSKPILVAAAFAILGIFHVPSTVLAWKNTFLPSDAAEDLVQRAEAIKSDVLSDEIGDWKKVDFQEHKRNADDFFGEFSRTYSYEHAQGWNVTVSLDFPFPGTWHELCHCYQHSGWTLENRATYENSDGNFVEASFSNPSQQSGWLIFSEFRGSGKPLHAPKYTVMDTVTRRLFAERAAPGTPGYKVFQVQIWTATNEETSDELKKAVRELFFECRSIFKDWLFENEAS